MLVMLHHIGYKKDPDIPGKLIIDKDAAKIVKRIFDLKLQGRTSKEIADLFNKEKIITPSEYLQIKGLENRTKKIWTRNIVTRILNNEVYIGKSLRGKTQNISYKSKKRIYIRRNEQVAIENTHEAIISDENYNQIHNNNKYGNIKTVKEIMDTRFLEYMYCGSCHQKMVRRRSRNYISIHCLNRNETDILCNNQNLFIYEYLEKIILKSIQENFDIYFRKNNISPSLLKKHNSRIIEKIKQESKDVDKELSMVKFKISKLYNDRLLEKISEENYKTEYNKLIEKRKKVNNIKEDLENRIDSMNQKDKDLDKYKKVKSILRKLKKNDLTSEEIGELIERIEINKDYIHIFYKFENMKSSKFPAIIEHS